MRYNLKGTVPQKKAREYLEKLIAKGADCEIVEKRGKRSNNQNAYYYAMVSLFAVETGYTRDEVHTLAKRQAGLSYKKNGSYFLVSTTTLDTKEMSDYTEKFRNWAGKEGIHLPGPDEYWHNVNEYNQIIAQNETTI